MPWYRKSRETEGGKSSSKGNSAADYLVQRADGTYTAQEFTQGDIKYVRNLGAFREAQQDAAIRNSKDIDDKLAQTSSAVILTDRDGKPVIAGAEVPPTQRNLASKHGLREVTLEQPNGSRRTIYQNNGTLEQLQTAVEKLNAEHRAVTRRNSARLVSRGELPEEDHDRNFS